MSREQLKSFMRDYIENEMVKVNILLTKYNGPDKEKHLRVHKKCEGLVAERERYLRYETLTKLTQYVELARRKFRK